MRKQTIPFFTLMILLTVSLSTLLSCSPSYSAIQKSISLKDAHGIHDGTYEGSYFLLPVSVNVSVEVRAGRIEAITILKHFNGRGKAAERIVSTILEKQSLDVDTVSGATHSSVTILKAVEAALKKGKTT